jgi:two-component system LytT family response regulator
MPEGGSRRSGATDRSAERVVTRAIERAPESRRGPVRALVADDEPAAREAVITMLAEHGGVELVGEATNGDEAVRLIRDLRPDLLFLDIQMPDRDGFGVLDALGEDVPRGVVFVTAHDEHAIRAFEVHALDYILKPFGRPRFRAAVSRALSRLSALDALTLRDTLESMASDRRAGTEPSGELSIQNAPERPASSPRRLGVRTGSHIVVVDIDAIDWVESYGDYARVHAGKQTHVVAQRMHALERLLEGGEFLRVHRSLIVNLGRIRELHRDADGGGTIILVNGVRLRVARGRWEALADGLRMLEL